MADSFDVTGKRDSVRDLGSPLELRALAALVQVRVQEMVEAWRLDPNARLDDISRRLAEEVRQWGKSR